MNLQKGIQELILLFAYTNIIVTDPRNSYVNELRI